jgi:hypothetical protein
MRRLREKSTVVLLGLLIAFSAPSPANATRTCPYWVSVSRENVPGEQTARICDLNRIAEWLGAVPDVTLTQAPQGALNDGFTVTLVTVAGLQHTGIELPAPGIGKVLLTERVYPIAGSGPVAFVSSRSVLFHRPGPFPKWVVSPGWRGLDATEPVPPVLARLGMLRPTLRAATPTLSAAPTPSAPSGSRGPDLVTLLFLVAILASIGGFVRRSVGRTHPRAEGDRSETFGMDDLHDP